MRKYVGLVVACLVSASVSTFAGATVMVSPQLDPMAGKALLEKSCMSCHASMFHGDATRIYTRPDRKVKSLQQLNAQVRACSANANAGWFPEDEANVAAYLNQKYYKFK